MKRFISRYAKVLRWRQQQEEECRGEVALLRKQRDDIEAFRDQFQNELEIQKEFCRSQMSSGVCGGMYWVMEKEMDNKRKQLRHINEVLQQSDQRLAESMQRHQETRKELKIVEELVHREQTEHHRRMLKAEELQNQERALQMFYRNQAGIETETES
ncbi:MAG: hypothetical protein ACK58L_02040 [Planctomycetota bacterium]